MKDTRINCPTCLQEQWRKEYEEGFCWKCGETKQLPDIPVNSLNPSRYEPLIDEQETFDELQVKKMSEY